MKEEKKDYWFDRISSTRMGEYTTKKELGYIKRMIGLPPLSCLDVGAGSGRYSVPLYSNGFEISALDYDIIPLKKLINQGIKFPLLQSDAQYLPFKDKSFNRVLAIEVVDYLDPDIFLKECSRVLKQEGLLIFSISNNHSYKGFIRPYIKKLTRKKLYTEFYRFSYNTFKNKLLANGFIVENCTGLNWLPAGRASNSRFLPMLSSIEDILNLKNFPRFSPWVLFTAKKI
jgi:ubiquinone/menaquinone biosynthesis C-methylase UbiE